MNLIYSTSKIEGAAKGTVKNPRMFQAIDPNAKKVLLNGDWPVVREAYEKAGVPVENYTPPKAASAQAKQPEGKK